MRKERATGRIRIREILAFRGSGMRSIRGVFAGGVPLFRKMRDRSRKRAIVAEPTECRHLANVASRQLVPAGLVNTHRSPATYPKRPSGAVPRQGTRTLPFVGDHPAAHRNRASGSDLPDGGDNPELRPAGDGGPVHQVKAAFAGRRIPPEDVVVPVQVVVANRPHLPLR